MIQEINGVIRNSQSKQLHNAMVKSNTIPKDKQWATKHHTYNYKTPHVQLQNTTRTTTKHHTYNNKTPHVQLLNTTRTTTKHHTYNYKTPHVQQQNTTRTTTTKEGKISACLISSM